MDLLINPWIRGIEVKNTPPCSRSGTNKGGILIKIKNDPKKFRLRRAKNTIFERFRVFPIVVIIFNRFFVSNDPPYRTSLVFL